MRVRRNGVHSTHSPSLSPSAASAPCSEVVKFSGYCDSSFTSSITTSCACHSIPVRSDVPRRISPTFVTLYLPRFIVLVLFNVPTFTGTFDVIKKLLLDTSHRAHSEEGVRVAETFMHETKKHPSHSGLSRLTSANL